MNIYTKPVASFRIWSRSPLNSNCQRLIGEALNVSPWPFQAKKAAMLKKLRTKGLGATHTIILCNADAVHERYGLAANVSEYHRLVDVTTAPAVCCRTGLERWCRSTRDQLPQHHRTYGRHYRRPSFRDTP